MNQEHLVQIFLIWSSRCQDSLFFVHFFARPVLFPQLVVSVHAPFWVYLKLLWVNHHCQFDRGGKHLFSYYFWPYRLSCAWTFRRVIVRSLCPSSQCRCFPLSLHRTHRSLHIFIQECSYGGMPALLRFGPECCS